MGETVDVLGEVHDHRHVVLDDQERQAALFVGRAQTIEQGLDQHRIDAGGRLVEQQHLRLVHQGHGEFEQLLLAEGEIPGMLAALIGEADKVEQFGGLRALRRRVPAEQAEEGCLAQGWRGEHVGLNGHAAIDARLLVGADQSFARNVLGEELGNLAAPEAHRAMVDGKGAGDGIEQGGLARAVRSDQADDGALGHLQADGIVGDDAAEALGHVPELEQSAHPGVSSRWRDRARA